ncbi:MAG: hypothetical protein MI755_16235 [Sphingomonadales bacterium]|nr:hypothetical protein [Sphingomonadales bacterium]
MSDVPGGGRDPNAFKFTRRFELMGRILSVETVVWMQYVIAFRPDQASLITDNSFLILALIAFCELGPKAYSYLTNVRTKR